MADKEKSRGRKTRMRALFVLEYLNSHVGKVVSASDIMEAFLEKYPFDYKEDSTSMNKYIYEDVHALQQFGYKVKILRGHGILMDTRSDGMTPTEVELIGTVISRSKMLAKKDKEALQDRLTGRFGVKSSGRTNIETLYKAIGEHDEKGCPIHPQMISFDYLIQEETVRLDFVSSLPRKSIEIKIVPLAVILPDATHSYSVLLGVDLKEKKVKPFRIDRMSKISPEGNYDKATLAGILAHQKVGATSAKETPLTVRVEILKQLLGWFIEQYGMPYTQNNNPANDETVLAEYHLSPDKVKTLFDFISRKKMVRLVGHQEAKEHYRNYLRAQIQRYNDMLDECK